MDPGLAAGAAAAISAVLTSFWGRRSKGEKDASGAEMLSRAFALSVDSQNKLVDNQQESLEDARRHIHRQDAEFAKMRDRHEEEIRELRAELQTVRVARETERGELESLRAELVAVREREVRLIARIATLEAQRATA